MSNAVERAAEEAKRRYLDAPDDTDEMYAAGLCDGFMHGAAWALSAAAPTVEEYQEVLAAHPSASRYEPPPEPRTGYALRQECDGCRAFVFRLSEHQAEQVAALWGGK